MLPLRDTVRSRRFSVVTYAIIGLNVLIFVFEASMGPSEFRRFLVRFGLIPTRLSMTQPLTYLTVFTSVFLHGSWFHLISNMWTLFIFGDNVEDRMGRSRYAVFYVAAGVLAGITHAWFVPQAQVPTVGASGAIAGVLGAYFMLFPTGRVLTLIPLFFLPWFVEIPAFIYLGVWFLSQLSSGLMSLGRLGASTFSGIAWWAHIGGFVAGVLLVGGFASERRRRPPASHF